MIEIPLSVVEAAKGRLGKRNTSYNRLGDLSPSFQQFLNFCKEEGLDLEQFGNVKFSELLYCILNRTLPHTCKTCGTPTRYIPEFGYRDYCSVTCRSKSREYRKKISVVKTAKYSDPTWKANVEKAKEETLMSRFGVRSPMHSVDLHQKQQKSCYGKKELAGYEKHGLEFLRRRFAGEIVNGTDYLKSRKMKISWQDDQNKERRSYPDFFIPEANCFVEIKSTYTRKVGDYKLGKCAEALDKLGYGYVIITITPRHRTRYILETKNARNIT